MKYCKKILNLFLCSVLMTGFCFAQGKALVLGNSVRVRSEPGMKGTPVGTKQISDLVEIYEYAGTGLYSDGIWDYWARIGNNQWINAYWVSEFPVFFMHEDEDYDLIRIDSVSDDGKTVHISNLAYYPVFENDILRDASLFPEDHVLRGYRIADTFYSYSNSTFLKDRIPYEERTDDNLFDSRFYDLGGIKVKAVIFPDFLAIDEISITTPDVSLMYGVKVGMTKDTVYNLCGEPVNIYDKRENKFKTQWGHIQFFFENNILTEIQYEAYR